MKQVCSPISSPWALFSSLAVVLALSGLGSPAFGLDKVENQKTRLKSCERKLCDLIVTKKPRKGQLKCDIGKKWGEGDIKKGADTKQIGWSFGDARCNVVVSVPRSEIISALLAPKYKLRLARHRVKCEVETGSGIEPLMIELSPRIKFKSGKAYKAWIKLRKVDGPPVLSSLIWTVAKLEDSFGIFHSEMLKEINKFIQKKCPKSYKAHLKDLKKKKTAKKQKTTAKKKPVPSDSAKTEKSAQPKSAKSKP